MVVLVAKLPMAVRPALEVAVAVQVVLEVREVWEKRVLAAPAVRHIVKVYLKYQPVPVT